MQGLHLGSELVTPNLCLSVKPMRGGKESWLAVNPPAPLATSADYISTASKLL